MQPSNIEKNDLPDDARIVFDYLHRMTNCAPDLVHFEDGRMTITLYLEHAPRNCRGHILMELIDQGWHVDYINFEDGIAGVDGYPFDPT